MEGGLSGITILMPGFGWVLAKVLLFEITTGAFMDGTGDGRERSQESKTHAVPLKFRLWLWTDQHRE